MKIKLKKSVIFLWPDLFDQEQVSQIIHGYHDYDLL